MLTKRLAQVGLFAVVAAVALALPGEAQAHSWSIVTVDPTYGAGYWSSIAIDPDGNPMISYYDVGPDDLKFAFCDMSLSQYGKCDQPGDWDPPEGWTVTVDSAGSVGGWSSLAVDANGDPMISYYDATPANLDLKFAWCDMDSDCSQSLNWTTMTVDSTGDVGKYTSIAVAASGDPWISYYDVTSGNLKAAVCPDWAGGPCDGLTKGWGFVALDETGDVGHYTSNGDTGEAGGWKPIISYFDMTNDNLKFAICRAPLDPGCSLPEHWDFVTVDSTGDMGRYSSIAADASGNPMISYHDDTNSDLRFARCLIGTDCDETGDWTTKVTVDSAELIVGHWTSIAADDSGNAMISYSYYESGVNQGVKLAWCDLAATGCDEAVYWGTEVVDSTLPAGPVTSLALRDGDPWISFDVIIPGDLHVATGVACDTILAGAASIDDTEISVNSLAGCEIDNYILIGDAPGDQDCRQIGWTESGDGYFIYFEEGLDNAQGQGEAVVEVPSCAPPEPPEPPYPPAPAEPDEMWVTLRFDYMYLDEDRDGTPEHFVPGPITFAGPGLFDRGDPYQDAGAGDRWTIDTEIVSMDLEGRVDGWDVTLTAGVDRGLPESLGQIQEQTPDSGGFPADSFFDVTFELNTANPIYGPMRNCDDDGPAHFDAVTNAVPAENVSYTPNVVHIDACEWEEPAPATGGSPQGWRWTSASAAGSEGTGMMYVGGIAEWPDAAAGPDSSVGPASDSGFNYAALGGALAAVAATVALATGAWFARRRWLT